MINCGSPEAYAEWNACHPSQRRMSLAAVQKNCSSSATFCTMRNRHHMDWYCVAFPCSKTGHKTRHDDTESSYQQTILPIHPILCSYVKNISWDMLRDVHACSPLKAIAPRPSMAIHGHPPLFSAAAIVLRPGSPGRDLVASTQMHILHTYVYYHILHMRRCMRSTCVYVYMYVIEL